MDSKILDQQNLMEFIVSEVKGNNIKNKYIDMFKSSQEMWDERQEYNMERLTALQQEIGNSTDLTY